MHVHHPLPHLFPHGDSQAAKENGAGFLREAKIQVSTPREAAEVGTFNLHVMPFFLLFKLKWASVTTTKSFDFR